MRSIGGRGHREVLSCQWPSGSNSEGSVTWNRRRCVGLCVAPGRSPSQAWLGSTRWQAWDLEPGDRDAFRRIVLALQTDVRVFIAWRLGNREDVEHVLQDTFLTAYRRLSTYHGGGVLRACLRGIARNHAYEALRERRRLQRHRHDVLDILVDDAAEAVSDAGDHEDELLRDRWKGAGQHILDTRRRPTNSSPMSCPSTDASTPPAVRSCCSSTVRRDERSANRRVMPQPTQNTNHGTTCGPRRGPLEFKDSTSERSRSLRCRPSLA